MPMLLSEEQHTTEELTMVNETVRKLQEMRLSVMAKTYLDQLDHPDDFARMSFDERFSLIVDREADVLTGSKAGRQGGQIGQGQHGIGGNRDAVDTKGAFADVADGEILAGSRANGQATEIVGFRSNREYGARHCLLHRHIVDHQVVVAIATDG